MAGFLRTRNVQFGGGSATRTAEQLPLELLPQVHALKDGQSIAVQAGDSVNVRFQDLGTVGMRFV